MATVTNVGFILGHKILKIIPVSLQPSRRAASIKACGNPWKACLNIRIANALTANGINECEVSIYQMQIHHGDIIRVSA